ncbi:MAG TPA: hypothetical protein VGI98_01700 [Candidatus Limnocylindrales bacterium]|jgi:tetratricopeptide (TPR) repeat protein
MARPLFEQYKDALRRGHVALLNDELDAALTAYREAATLVPDRPLPFASIAGVLDRLGRADEAVVAYDQAAALTPDDPAIAEARAAAAAVAEQARAAQPDVPPQPDVPAQPDLPPQPDLPAPAGATPEATAHGSEAPPDAPPAKAAAAVDPAVAERRAAELAAAADAEAAALDAMRAALEPRAEDAAAEPASEPAADVPSPPAAAAEPEPSFYVDRAPDVVMDAERNWPAIDLPSPPPTPLVGPPPDSATIQAEADALVDSGDMAGARDLLLLAIAVHRDAGRLDAALDACLQLLAVAPGDPSVHLAIANLQLDRGWRPVATEKIELLLRLTSLSGDSQAEADVHLLAAERLRDEDPARLDARRRGLPTA